MTGRAATWAAWAAGFWACVATAGVLALADAVRVAWEAWGTAPPGDVAVAAAATAALVVPVGLLTGTWAGLVVVGLLGNRRLGRLPVLAARVLRVLPRPFESRRVASLLVVMAAVACWGVAGVALHGVVAARVHRPLLASLLVVGVLLAVGVALAASQPAASRVLAWFFSLRSRVVARQTGLFSLRVLLGFLACVAAGGVAASWLPLYNLLYAMDLSPVVYAVGTVVLAPGLLLLLASRRGAWLLSFLASPAVVTALVVGVGASVLGARDVVSREDRVREVLYEGSPAASLVHLALTPGPPPPPGPQEQEEEPDGDTASACACPEPVGGPAVALASPPHLLVISVETLRADHSSTYGYTARDTTPALTALASTGTRFHRAYASGPCSSSSFTGLITGQLPSRLGGITRNGDVFTLRRSVTTLAGRLRAAGYRTVGMLPVVADYLKGLELGFDEFDRSFHYAEAQARRVMEVLERHRPERPLFLWAHFVDPHFPYDPQPGLESWGRRPQDLYDQEIAHVDRNLARVFRRLADTGAMDRTVVVVLADHGEAFGEHGTRLHGNSLHDEEIRVPFIFAGRGVRTGVVQEPVSLLDLAPTLVEAAGLTWTGPAPTGVSLWGTLTTGRVTTGRVVLAEGCKPGTMLALIDARKLFYRKRGDRYLLYDLANDPRERVNLFGSAPDSDRLAALVKQEMELARP
jgi:arylsulfatase A-like enzyme